MLPHGQPHRAGVRGVVLEAGDERDRLVEGWQRDVVLNPRRCSGELADRVLGRELKRVRDLSGIDSELQQGIVEGRPVSI